MANYYYNAEETKAWLAKQPKKPLATKAIFISDKNNVLVVKPNYSKGWHLPGGSVDQLEDPKTAIIREVYEEIGIQSTIFDFKIIDTYFNSSYDNIILVYKYAYIISEKANIVLQKEELEEYKFEKIENLSNILSDVRISSTEWSQLI